MAYNSDGYGTFYQQAPLFSTPLVSYQGTNAGDAQDGDNTRLINQTIATVAAYRNSETTLTGITISGPTSVNENSTASYTATASWSDGSTRTVSPSWSEDSEYTTISSAGVLTTFSVPSSMTISVSASFTSEGVTKTDTHTVTVVNVATTPTITTTPISSITTSSASSGGTITSDGGSAVTARGVCWSTSENPTTGDSSHFGRTRAQAVSPAPLRDLIPAPHITSELMRPTSWAQRMVLTYLLPQLHPSQLRRSQPTG